MNHEPAFLDALQAAKTRVLTLHGTNYLQAILPEIVALARSYERILERSWPHAYRCRFNEIVSQHQPGPDLEESDTAIALKLDRLAAAYWEFRINPVVMVEVP